MAKCVAAYHDDTTVNSSATPITGQARRAQKSIARTTSVVIIFMGSAESDGQREGMFASLTIVSGVKTKAKWRR